MEFAGLAYAITHGVRVSLAPSMLGAFPIGISEIVSDGRNQSSPIRQHPLGPFWPGTFVVYDLCVSTLSYAGMKGI